MIDKIEKWFDVFEKKYFMTEKEIYEACIELVKSSNFNKEFIYDLNDVLYNRGYSFQFEIEEQNDKFEINKYNELCSNTSKSKNKTKNLIDYLNSINSFRLSLATLHKLKVKYLIELGYIKENDYINKYVDKDLKTLLFHAYEEDINTKEYLINILPNFGIKYSTLEYVRFKLDMEYLLWTIEKNDNKAYIKVNTLKVALNIAPKEYFIFNNKRYYNENFSIVTKNYLKLIDKNSLNKIYNIWQDEGYNLDDTGYSVLYGLLINLIKK